MTTEFEAAQITDTSRALRGVAQEARASGSKAYTLLVGGTAIFCGFVNFLPDVGGQYFATFVIDSALLLGVLLVCGKIASSRAQILGRWVIGYGFCCLVFLTLCIISPERPAGLIVAFRNLLGYAAFAAVVSLFSWTEQAAKSCIDILLCLGTALSLFGVAQYVFRGRLPQALVEPRDTAAFSYYGTDIVRANGLVGNTIVFGTLLTLIFLVTLSRALVSKHLIWLMLSIVQFAAVMCTYSRMAIISSLVGAIVVINWLLFNSVRTRIGWGILAIIAGFLVSQTMMLSRVFDSWRHSFVFGGLFGAENESVAGSNAGHIEDIRIGLEVLARRPIIGLGIGTQAATSERASSGAEVVTDGLWWMLAAEGGVILVVLILCLLALTAGEIMRVGAVSSTLRPYCIGILVYLFVQYGLAGFVNSGALGKAPTVLLWIFVGLAMSGPSTGKLGDEKRSGVV